jgi:hypothetical protein
MELVIQNGEVTMAGHGGLDPGVSAMVAHQRAAATTIVVLCNHDHVRGRSTSTSPPHSGSPTREADPTVPAGHAARLSWRATSLRMDGSALYRRPPGHSVAAQSRCPGIAGTVLVAPLIGLT